jgi:hypothetical protein
MQQWGRCKHALAGTGKVYAGVTGDEVEAGGQIDDIY